MLVTVDDLDPIRVGFDPLKQTPLIENEFRIDAGHGSIDGAVPDGQRRPRPLVRRRLADQRGGYLGCCMTVAAHPLQRLRHRGCRAVGKTGDDRTAGEDLGIGCEHHRRHRAAC